MKFNFLKTWFDRHKHRLIKPDEHTTRRFDPEWRKQHTFLLPNYHPEGGQRKWKVFRRGTGNKP